MTWYALERVYSKRSDEILCLGLIGLIYGSELRSVAGHQGSLYIRRWLGAYSGALLVCFESVEMTVAYIFVVGVLSYQIRVE
jgi:hypothetical protein